MQFSIGLCKTDVNHVQPLVGKVCHKITTTSRFQHPFNFLVNRFTVAQLSVLGQRQQFPIRCAVVDHVAKSRRDRVVIKDAGIFAEVHEAGRTQNGPIRSSQSVGGGVTVGDVCAK